MADEKNSLITDIAGLSKPMTKLIEVVSSGMNIATTPWQTKRNAKADSEAIQILSQSLETVPGEVTYTNPNFSITVKNGSVEENTITRVIQQEIERQINLSAIVSKTATLLEQKESVSSEPLEKDWMTNFKNIAQDISNQEMQLLWARILSQEIEEPHSFSYRTLDFLKSVQPSEAKIIENVLKYSFSDVNYVFILGDKEYLQTVNIPFEQGLLLEELGLATGNLVLRIEPNATEYYRVSQSNNYVRISNPTTQPLDIPTMKLTTLGKEVFQLTPNYFDLDNIAKHIAFFNLFDSAKFELLENVIFSDDGQNVESSTQVTLLNPTNTPTD